MENESDKVLYGEWPSLLLLMSGNASESSGDIMNDILLLDDDESSASAEFNSTAAMDVMPAYIRLTTTIILSCLLVVGITGNVLVPIVIAHSKDLRNSTNVFLVNLALADLLVILICLPTGFVELHSSPGVWYVDFIS